MYFLVFFVFLVYFLYCNFSCIVSYLFPSSCASPVSLSLTCCRAVTPSLISKWIVCTSLIVFFVCISGLMSYFSLNIPAFFALLFQSSQCLLSDVFQLLYRFHHGITAFFGGRGLGWGLICSCYYCFLSHFSHSSYYPVHLICSSGISDSII